MASQISPGVVLRERDLSNAVIVNTSSITGAFASTFQKGPIGEVVNIASQKDLLTVFGEALLMLTQKIGLLHLSS